MGVNRQTSDGSEVEANGVDMNEVIFGTTRAIWLGRIDRMSSTTAAGMAKIQLARTKLLRGDPFGVCEGDDGGAHLIAQRRLELNPTVELCIRCQNKAESHQTPANCRAARRRGVTNRSWIPAL